MKKLSIAFTVLFAFSLLFAAGVSAQQPIMPVCHINGEGTYNLINVAEPAYDTHLAHGDAAIGDAVPGMPGYLFNADCQLEYVPPADGCYTDGSRSFELTGDLNTRHNLNGFWQFADCTGPFAGEVLDHVWSVVVADSEADAYAICESLAAGHYANSVESVTLLSAQGFNTPSVWWHCIIFIDPDAPPP